MSAETKAEVEGKREDRLKVVAQANPVAKAPGEIVPAPKPAKPPAKAKPGRMLDSSVDRAIRSARRKTRRIIIASIALMVGLPTALGILYFGFIAADQYSVEARFAVRGADSSGMDLVGMMTGAASSAANVGDSYIVQEYIGSREMVDTLDQRIGVRERYDNPIADFWMRFPATDPIESFVGYWQSMVTAEFDSFSGIITLKVRAFTPEDALTIASEVVTESEALVNRLSERSRLDTVAFAQREVQFAEERLREARGAVTALQSEENTVDPTATAEALQTQLAERENQLANAEGERAQLQGLAEDAPSVRFLTTRIAVLQQQIADLRARVSTGIDGVSGGLSGQLAAFQELQTEAEFAERAYVSTMASLEAARAEAKRTQRYLATFVSPQVPQDAIYPLRLINSSLIFVISLIFWGISALLYAAVRDHMV
jgi:capsular polysaccharide transport system permease protein